MQRGWSGVRPTITAMGGPVGQGLDSEYDRQWDIALPYTIYWCLFWNYPGSADHDDLRKIMNRSKSLKVWWVRLCMKIHEALFMTSNNQKGPQFCARISCWAIAFQSTVTTWHLSWTPNTHQFEARISHLFRHWKTRDICQCNNSGKQPQQKSLNNQAVDRKHSGSRRNTWTSNSWV